MAVRGRGAPSATGQRIDWLHFEAEDREQALKQFLLMLSFKKGCLHVFWPVLAVDCKVTLWIATCLPR
jgi:hypothetical protein